MKFQHYRLIPTFEEYLLVSQETPLVEQFIRQGEFAAAQTRFSADWLLRTHSDPLQFVPLSSLPGVNLSLSELYSGVEWL